MMQSYLDLSFRAANLALEQGKRGLANGFLACPIVTHGPDARGRLVVTLGCTGDVEDVFAEYSGDEHDWVATPAAVSLLRAVWPGEGPAIDVVRIVWRHGASGLEAGLDDVLQYLWWP